jgi:hypothetical protein
MHSKASPACQGSVSLRGERLSLKTGQFRCGLENNDDAIGIKRNVCVVGGYSVYGSGSEYASRGRERVQTNGPEVRVFTNYDQDEAR